jgi:hypothetical protein
MNTKYALFVLALFIAPSYAGADIFGSGANTFGIEFVTVGDPGNIPDTTGAPNPAGSVDYTYRIGKYEISEQMIDDANIAGGLEITKVTRSPEKAASGISWNEAARFVNWLNTSTGYTPAYKFAIQPGEAGYDPNANIELWMPGDAGYNPDNLFRNRLARYVLPSVDEWYKAAYYDPTSGTYYNYPTGSDSPPAAVSSGTAPGTAVYNHFAAGPADITMAGGLSPYGTMAQGGNVFEYEETEFDLVNDGSSGIDHGRGYRPSNWASSDVSSLSPSSRTSVSTTGNPIFIGNHGFRVASQTPIPEPESLALLVAVFAPALRHRERREACRNTAEKQLRQLQRANHP